MKYTVTAIAPSNNRKVVAERVGAMRAAKLAKAIRERGFEVEVKEV